MFSGKVAFENLHPNQLIVALYVKKQRPSFDDQFPQELQEKITRGWSHEPQDRCSLNDYLEVLLKMRKMMNESMPIIEPKPANPICTISMLEQANEIQTKSLAYSPMIDMNWSSQGQETKALMEKMITEMTKSSSFSKIFPQIILNATKQVPKHLFVDMNILKKAHGINEDKVCLELIYAYSKAIRASETQNMSSTEISCAQLSLIPLNPGERILFLGAKGGYIQTIAAQIVGFQGEVWICSQDRQGIDHVKNLMNLHVPPIIKQIVRCILVDEVQNANKLKIDLARHIPSIEQYFNTIHVCGAIPQETLDDFQELLKVEGQLLAPIKVDDQTQRFTILHKTRDSNSGKIIFQKRILTDWGVIFAPVL